MTFKSRYQVVLYIGINIRGGAFVRNLLVVLEKPAEILEHCEQFSTELHLVFPFLTWQNWRTFLIDFFQTTFR